MKPYYQQDKVTIYCGDCIEVMADMPENSVDAIVTDPPYGLEFMGKEWDKLATDIPQWVRDRMSGADAGHSWQGEAYRERGNYMYHRLEKHKARLTQLQSLWHQQWATQALRVLKPGGYLLAFGGTRTEHRLKCGLEDAGFEIRDTILWLYGSGFPKNMDISKQIDKAVGAEREKIGTRSIAADQWTARSRDIGGRGKYDIPITSPATEAAKEWQGWGTALKPAVEFVCVARKPLSEKTVAENVLKWGTGGMDIDGARVEYQGQQDWNNTFRPSTNIDKNCWIKNNKVARRDIITPQGRWPANVILDEEAARMLDEQSGESKSSGGSGEASRNWKGDGHTVGSYMGMATGGFGDSGSASRFFYCAKASSSERGKNNKHPTCKPVSLMEYLIKLVSREGAIILDPFGGSMSTVLAAVATGRQCIAIEQSEEYCEMLKGRCRQMELV